MPDLSPSTTTHFTLFRLLLAIVFSSTFTVSTGITRVLFHIRATVSLECIQCTSSGSHNLTVALCILTCTLDSYFALLCNFRRLTCNTYKEEQADSAYKCLFVRNKLIQKIYMCDGNYFKCEKKR